MDNINKPILILGCTKSGTTLMRNLFDGHKDLFIIPTESHFFQNINYWVSYFFRSTKPKKLNFDGMKKNLIGWIEFMDSKENRIADGFTQGKWELDIFREAIQNGDVKNTLDLSNLYVKAMYKSLCKKEFDKNLRFVEKSVENAEMALDWLKLYPEAKFIHILRNPYSNLVAIRKYLNRNRFPFLKSAVLAMYNSYYYLYKNLRLINQKQYKVVRYEDLISQPEKIMQDVSHFLNIDYSEELTKPTVFGETWGGNSTSGVKFKGVSKMNLEKWKTEISNYEVHLVNRFFEHVLSDFGFSKIEAKGSIYRVSSKENPKTYFLNRLLPYYLPKFSE